MGKLFVYGTLGPGKPNQHILNNLGGNWSKGFVEGKLFHEGWGAEMGYPGIRLEEKEEVIKGHIFDSDSLEDHWDMLDRFEGSAYERVQTNITLSESETETLAFIYVLK